ncbi:MAG: cation diffusion facilitator family transporter [Gemmatimonadota bacterium]|nr:cation diffusion facilitator family transporter [Gemmatimonadota bacterium]
MAKGGTRAVVAALIANAIIAVAKFIAAAVTGSSAMLSEGIHSVADSGNQALLLFGDRRSRRPPDRTHPFGYGPELYFWSLIVAMILFGLGGGLSIYEGIAHLDHPVVPSDPLWTYSVLGVAFVVELIALRVALKELGGSSADGSFLRRLRASSDPRVFVPIAEDFAALLGVVIAFAGIFFARLLDLPMLDAASSIVIGCILAGVAVFLAIETRSLLVGESVDERLVETVRSVCENDPAVERVVRIRGVYLGPAEVLLALDVRFRVGPDQEAVAFVVDRLEERLRAADARIARILIEPDLAVEGTAEVTTGSRMSTVGREDGAVP